MTRKSTKIGLIVRCDKTGLGNQTRAIYKMLNPEKIMVIDLSFYNNNKQYPEWYKDHLNKVEVIGFPDRTKCKEFLDGLDAVISCETFYNYFLLQEAKRKGIKTYLQYNYEFLDYLQQPLLTKPTQFLSPSTWHIEKVQGAKLLPAPLFLDEYEENRRINAQERPKKRFLHIVGKQAIHDRNGTYTLLSALQYSTGNYELVIKAQSELEHEIYDKRVIYDYENPDDNKDLYKGFDAVILPRKYGGQCLPMNEALASGLPVIMTDISPNNDILPKKWLINANKIDEFMTRTMIDIYEADAKELGKKIDEFAQKDLSSSKVTAFEIAKENFDSKRLEKRYKEVLCQ